MGAQIREMVLADYDAVIALWKSTPGVDIRPVTDSREGIERLLHRNPGLSFVAVNDGELVGCALASHDGRRGFLQHVVRRGAKIRSVGLHPSAAIGLGAHDASLAARASRVTC